MPIKSVSNAIATRGLFSTRDNTTLYYEVTGEGRPLVFCYGLLCQREHWRHQIQYFSKFYRVVTFDYRGHQYSSAPKNDQHMTLEWCAKDLEDLMNYLAIEEAVVLGHSMGVAVLTHLASHLIPNRIRAAVFVCGTVTNPFANMFGTSRMNQLYRAAAALYDVAPLAATALWEQFTQKSRLNYFVTSRLGFNASRAEEEDVELYIDGVAQTPFSTFQAIMKDYTRFDGRPLLREIHCPTLVIAGEDDLVTPVSLQEEMAEFLPKGEIYKIPEGSHNAHMDFPDKVNVSIEDFLTRVGYR